MHVELQETAEEAAMLLLAGSAWRAAAAVAVTAGSSLTAPCY